MKTRSKILIAFGVIALLGCGAGWYFLNAKPAEKSNVPGWERFVAKSLIAVGMKNAWTADVQRRILVDGWIRIANERTRTRGVR